MRSNKQNECRNCDGKREKYRSLAPHQRGTGYIANQKSECRYCKGSGKTPEPGARIGRFIVSASVVGGQWRLKLDCGHYLDRKKAPSLFIIGGKVKRTCPECRALSIGKKR